MKSQLHCDRPGNDRPAVVEAGLILGIAASTVDNHKFRAMRLLGIRKIAILTRYAMLNGISNLEDCLTLEELERMRGSRR